MSPTCLIDIKMEKMTVRSFLGLVRANSANNAAPAPAPNPGGGNSINYKIIIDGQPIGKDIVVMRNSPTINLLPMIMNLELAAKYIKFPACPKNI